YAPKGELVIAEGGSEAVIARINEMIGADRAAGLKTGVMACDENSGKYIADVVRKTGAKGDQKEAARRLYSILRSFDDEDVSKIYAESFDTDGFGAAIMNRLLKAAGHKIIRV
ncbi:MAG: threonylcarbamoyl-AMP synthase, partial [Lachnospiraceae bacterium]|nr:threonylcarbamoyl-AMP synthase [Lachnospiraceae bacterium]